MCLKLTYTAETTVPVEVEGVTPEVVQRMSCGEIERLEVHHGNRKRPLADFFRVQGDPSDARMEFEGNLAGVHWLGAGMRDGEIHVAGDVGRHLGSEMKGGRIHVEGNAGDWVGGEMHGGSIVVRGDAGHLVGAAYRGSPRGMTQGTILILGNAGYEIGHSMRRGLIAIAGNVGDMPGFNMIAGTIMIFGDCGIRAGAGMKRGTIALLGPNRPELLPTFRRATKFEPLILTLLFRELTRLGFRQELVGSPFPLELYHGDFLEGGRGEIWTRAAP